MLAEDYASAVHQQHQAMQVCFDMLLRAFDQVCVLLALILTCFEELDCIICKAVLSSKWQCKDTVGQDVLSNTGGVMHTTQRELDDSSYK